MLGMPPGTVVSDLEIVGDPHLLVAGTYGSGAWKFVFDRIKDPLFADGFEGVPQ